MNCSLSSAESLCRVALAALCLLITTGFASAQEHAPTEHEIKAAFLYNFAKFVEWPADSFKQPMAPFVLCIVGAEPYAAARDMLSGKAIKGHPLLVRSIGNDEAPNDCHLLFVGAPDMDRTWARFAASNPHVLKVGDATDFIRRGGVIKLVRVANKFRFEINRNAGERGGFQFNYQLLQLAILVDDQG